MMDKEIMMRLKFVKENGKTWYIDLPNWTGRKSALQMVAGADTLLDLISSGNDEVILFVSTENFDGSNLLTKVKKCWFNGADYYCKEYNGMVINHDLWLCDVTKLVLGYFPDKIYFAKLKI